MRLLCRTAAPHQNYIQELTLPDKIRYIGNSRPSPQENRERQAKASGMPLEDMQPGWLWDTRPFVICAENPTNDRDSNGVELLNRLMRALGLRGTELEYGEIGYGTDIKKTHVIRFNDDATAARAAELLRADAPVKTVENFAVDADPDKRAQQFANLYMQHLECAPRR